MINIKIKAIFILTCLLIINSIILANCFGNDKSKERVVFYDGVTLYGKLNNGERFEATITKKPYKSDGSKYTKKFWGYDKEYPTFLIEKFKLLIGGSEPNIPKEAIEDIADILLPRGFYLMQKGDKVIVIIRGGDAAGAYTAALTFTKNRLVSRTISFINSKGEKDSITTNY